MRIRQDRLSEAKMVTKMVLEGSVKKLRLENAVTLSAVPPHGMDRDRRGISYRCSPTTGPRCRSETSSPLLWPLQSATKPASHRFKLNASSRARNLGSGSTLLDDSEARVVQRLRCSVHGQLMVWALHYAYLPSVPYPSHEAPSSAMTSCQ